MSALMRRRREDRGEEPARPGRAQEDLNLWKARQKELLENVSHEFRTPVAAIRGFAETLRRGAVGDVRNRVKFLKCIEKHADKLERLVEEMLSSFSLEEAARGPDFGPVELYAFLRRSVEEIAPLAEKLKISVEIEAESEVRAAADPALLGRVLQNLLSNAIKYNRRGGWVRIAARKKYGQAMLSVSDGGGGIAPEHLPHIFERFYKAGSGPAQLMGRTGLGLPIVKQIVEAHGGGIWAESKPGQGSSFHFTLPLWT